jgi:hypothetical protein
LRNWRGRGWLLGARGGFTTRFQVCGAAARRPRASFRASTTAFRPFLGRLGARWCRRSLTARALIPTTIGLLTACLARALLRAAVTFAPRLAPIASAFAAPAMFALGPGASRRS